MNKVFLVTLSLINSVFAGTVEDKPEHRVTIFDVHDLFREMYDAHVAFASAPTPANQDRARNTFESYREILLSIPAGDKRLLALIALNKQYKKNFQQ